LTTNEDTRRNAFAGPRALKEPGSIQWCYQTLELLKIRWEREESTAADLRAILDEVKTYKVWEKIPPEQPYGSEEDMLRAELGVGAQEAEREILSRHDAGARGGRGKKAMEGLHSFSGGMAPSYERARLKRERPDLYELVHLGKMTLNAAVLTAGFRLPRFKVPVHPQRAAAILEQHFDQAQLRELVALLLAALEERGAAGPGAQAAQPPAAGRGEVRETPRRGRHHAAAGHGPAGRRASPCEPSRQDLDDAVARLEEEW
jgi:hypothetical protein